MVRVNADGSITVGREEDIKPDKKPEVKTEKKKSVKK